MPAKDYLLETRPQFLVLSVVVVGLAAGMAAADGPLNLPYAVLALAGLLLLHVSVNTLNDYHDYRSGIDLATNRTPFSGGSGKIPAGEVSPTKVLLLGVVSFLLAVPIGIFFLWERGIFLLPLFLLGALFVLAYTPLLTRLGGGAAEFSAGLGLGTLPVVGTYYVLTGTLTGKALYGAIPSGLLVTNLLLLSEFPDTEADRLGGRKTLPIVLGKDLAARLYCALTAATFLWIAAGVLRGWMPPTALIALLALPAGLRAARGALAHGEADRLISALRSNVLFVLLTQLLLAIAYAASSLPTADPTLMGR